MAEWLRARHTFVAALFGVVLLPFASRAQTDWATFGFDAQRTGYNPSETALSTSTVPNLKLHWKRNLGASMLTQPLVLSRVPVGSKTIDLVYVATLAGNVYALKATTGAIVWTTQTPVISNKCVGSSTTGVIATMTAIRSQNLLLVEAGDGTLHGLDIATGVERTGYPLQLLDSANLPPTTLIYGATVLWPYLYATSAGCQDKTPYHGQVVQVDLSVPAVANRWFTNGQSGPNGGGIWGSGGASIEPGMPAGTAPVYVATGNALPRTATSTTFSEHVVQLSGQLQVLASDLPQLTGKDDDFGATPLLYQPPGCPPKMAVMNKSGALFVYDRNGIGSGATQRLQIANISDQTQAAPGSFIGVPAYDPVHLMLYLGNPATSADGVYSHGLIALSVQANCSLALAWQQPIGVNDGTTENPMIAPVVANGVVYYSDGIGSQVAAFDAANGTPLWNSGTIIPKPAFASPSVVNGTLFVADQNGRLYAFGL